MPSWRKPAIERRSGCAGCGRTAARRRRAPATARPARRRARGAGRSARGYRSMPRLPAFIAAPGLVPVARSAGVKPEDQAGRGGEQRREARRRASRGVRSTKTGSLSVVEERDEEAAQPLRHHGAAARRRPRRSAGSRPAAGGRCGRATRRSPGARRSRARAPSRAPASGWRDSRRRSAARAPVDRRAAATAATRSCARSVDTPVAAGEGAELERQIVLRVLGAVARRQRRLRRCRARSPRAARSPARASSPASGAPKTPRNQASGLLEPRCARRASNGSAHSGTATSKVRPTSTPKNVARRHADDVEGVAVERSGCGRSPTDSPPNSRCQKP